jgi:hypothetical protein
LSPKSEWPANKTIIESKTKMANINPEDKMLNLYEETEFLEEYTRTEYDTLRPAYGDCDFDMDNYGYDY